MRLIRLTTTTTTTAEAAAAATAKRTRLTSHFLFQQSLECRNEETIRPVVPEYKRN